MIMLGGVPIIVIIPPNMLAKANGIKIILGDRPCFKEVFMATGNINAKAPTLFMNPEKIDTRLLKLNICIFLFFDSGIINLESMSITPEFLNARLIMRTAATVMTAG